MRSIFSSLVVLGLTSIVSVINAQTNDTGAVPIVKSPRPNVWKALSKQESSSVSNLLSERLELSGDQGSRYDGLSELVSSS